MKEKRKGIAKVMALKPRRCEDMKENVAPEIGPKSFETFEKHGPVSQTSRDVSGLFRVPLVPCNGLFRPEKVSELSRNGPQGPVHKAN